MNENKSLIENVIFELELADAGSSELDFMVGKCLKVISRYADYNDDPNMYSDGCSSCNSNYIIPYTRYLDATENCLKEKWNWNSMQNWEGCKEGWAVCVNHCNGDKTQNKKTCQTVYHKVLAIARTIAVLYTHLETKK